MLHNLCNNYSIGSDEVHMEHVEHVYMQHLVHLYHVHLVNLVQVSSEF